ncbi:MAG: hypothetical protein L0Z62_09250 [Gemmataceae bacterium]|nr:hypothetical protein [Gemmataceae bacterium]
MHHHEGMSPGLQTGLAIYYFLVALMNVGFVAHLRRNPADVSHLFAGPDTKLSRFFRLFRPVVEAISRWEFWAVVTAVFLFHSVVYLFGADWVLPMAARHLVDNMMNAVSYFVLAVVGFLLLLRFRRFFTEPVIAWLVLSLILLFGGWAMTDPNFEAIITKADNVPIVLLIFSVGFCTWLAMRQAVLNDDRLARGEPPAEKMEDDKVLVWPDLVYTELIAMVVCTVVLLVWAIFLKAPLEQPASSARIPNPSKAPWYFLGLQEMLVYFDPWMAGVVLPTFIIVGLIAIPYIDYNQRGNGYFTFVQRKFSISMFLFGFLVLWVTLIVLGTFLRGPNWNFFGPFESWDPHKTVPLNNVNLSDYFWLGLFGQSVETKGWFIRELPGILLILGYLLLLPPILAKTVMRPLFIKMGFMRFFVLVTLIQFMALLPIKMVLRWTINLKYIVFIPEAFFNI